MPIPRAASTASRSTRSTPSKLLVRIGPRAEHGERDHVVHEADARAASGTPRSARGSGARGRRSTRRSRRSSRGGNGRARRPSGSATRARSPSAAPESSSCSSAFVREEARVVADEAERVDERVQVRGVGEDHATPFRAHGTSTRRSADEQRVAGERERDRERAGRVDLRLERRRLLEREEDRVAEALRQQERGDRRDRDRRDDGDAQPADDRRHGERQLDARAASAAASAPCRAPPRAPRAARCSGPRRSSGTGSRACTRRARSRPSSS